MHRAVTDGERFFAMRQILTPAVRGELMIDKLGLALL
jgi:hypothetical protein